MKLVWLKLRGPLSLSPLLLSCLLPLSSAFGRPVIQQSRAKQNFIFPSSLALGSDKGPFFSSQSTTTTTTTHTRPNKNSRALKVKKNLMKVENEALSFLTTQCLLNSRGVANLSPIQRVDNLHAQSWRASDVACRVQIRLCIFCSRESVFLWALFGWVKGTVSTVTPTVGVSPSSATMFDVNRGFFLLLLSLTLPTGNWNRKWSGWTLFIRRHYGSWHDEFLLLLKKVKMIRFSFLFVTCEGRCGFWNAPWNSL